MFSYLYTLIIHLSVALAHIVALFHTKTRKWVSGQQNITPHGRPPHGRPQSYVIPHTSSHCIWFHAASLGEFEQGRPVIEVVRKVYPNAKIVLTFFSPSGHEIQKNYNQADLICYLPADTPTNVKRFLDEIKPDVALFIKYEFWYNYLRELKKRQISTLLFSAIFRPNQLFFKWYGGFYRKMLFCFDTILVQNQVSQDLLLSVGYSNVVLAGDTRLDRVAQVAAQAKSYSAIEAFRGNIPLLIIGSAWPDDMEILIPFLNTFNKPLKVIIAPHEINQVQIQAWQLQLQKASLRFTALEKHSEFDILFLDTIGMLSSIYRYADFAYIGGAFGDGLHNILEPAAFGMPIFFGKPHYQKFQEAHDLLHLGGAVAVSNSNELREIFVTVYENQEIREKKSAICRSYVQKNKGATEKVMISILYSCP